MPPVNVQLAMPKHARVLVVEDELRLRELLLDVIPEMGFAAAAVRTAEEGIRVMDADPVEIILLDLQLPLMSGMDFFDEVRKRWPGTKVIIMTGFGDLETARKAIRLDVVDFITKPFHLSDVEIALDRARKPFSQVLPKNESLIRSDYGKTLAQTEREAILAALARHDGNRTAAATELGISRRKLHYWLNENP